MNIKWPWKREVVQKYTIVEIDKPQMPVELEVSAADIASLRNHSGFNHLLRRLDYQRARLKSDLATSRHTDLRAVDFLQSGIYWCEWLRQQVDFAHDRYLSMRDASELESKFFESINSQIQRIGATTPE